jgi:hypothetical protein
MIDNLQQAIKCDLKLLPTGEIKIDEPANQASRTDDKKLKQTRILALQ